MVRNQRVRRVPRARGGHLNTLYNPAPMAPAIDPAFLRAADLFQSQPDEVLRAVLAQGRLEEFGPGATVFLDRKSVV